MAKGEIKRTALAALSFYLLLCSYYVLRPVRDEMAVRTGADRLPWLFTGTLLCALIAIPVFGGIVRCCSRSLVIPIVYGTFIGSLLVFYVAFSTTATGQTAAIFFIWFSLFNLFVISLFWSTVSNSFTTEEAARRYGLITAGGTAGAVTGPLLTAVLAEPLGVTSLLLVSAMLLSAALPGLMALCSMPANQRHDSKTPIGGTVLAGISQTTSIPLLRWIAGLIICYAMISSVLYIEINDLIGKEYTGPQERTAFFARMDFGVNILAVSVQLFLTHGIIQRWGPSRTLQIAPWAILTGFICVAASPKLYGIALVQVLHRSVEFSLSRPSREILFTTIDAQTRYHAKNFIDTALHQASDAFSSWIVIIVRSAGLSPIWFVAGPVIALWFGFCDGTRRRYQHDKETSNPISDGCRSPSPASPDRRASQQSQAP